MKLRVSSAAFSKLLGSVATAVIKMEVTSPYPSNDVFGETSITTYIYGSEENIIFAYPYGLFTNIEVKGTDEFKHGVRALLSTHTNVLVDNSYLVFSKN